MAKLKDDYSGRFAIGNEALIAFIDEINEMRARSGNRMRFRPQRRTDGVVWMQEFDEIQRPRSAHSHSQRYSR
jgi:hypothetical protein